MELIESLELAVAAAQTGRSEGFFALLFFGLGFACLYSIFYQLRLRSWPSTPGQLLKADTREFGAAKLVPAETDYINAVAYEYAVNGEDYLGKRFSPWVVVASHNLKFLLEKQQEGFEAGQTVSVYYNPRKPAKAFLKRPGIVGLAVTAVFTLGCFATPVLIFAR